MSEGDTIATLGENATCILQCEQLTCGGDGLGFHDGLPIFVRGAAPGDQLQVRITRRLAHHAFAEIVQVLAPSTARVTPRCPVFGDCGGCDWQHLAYDTQVLWKTHIVREQLTRLAKLTAPVVHECVPAPEPWHYRSRIHLQRDAQGRVGFYARDSHRVVEFDHCYIADARLNATLATRKAELARTDRGRDLRVHTEENHETLVPASDSTPTTADLGFAQVNPAQNEILRAALTAQIATQPRAALIVELFAGSGNFTFALAPHAEKIIAVETHAGLVAAGAHAARTRGCTHVEFRHSSAEKFMTMAMRGQFPIDGVVLDPPRRGAVEILTNLRTLAPRWIAYISCDTATLARDLRTLTHAADSANAHARYRHTFTQPFDMFPQTHHIETFTWLEKI